MASERVYGYVLAKSVLRVHAERFEVEDTLRGEKHRVSEPVFEIATMGDAQMPREIRLPNASSDTTSAVLLHPDRRLASVEATSEGRGPARLSSAVKVGGAVVGALLSAAAAPVSGGVSVAATAIAAVARRPAKGAVGARAPAEGGPPDRAEPPTAEESPLVAAYRREHPREADLLVTYRRGIAGLLDRNAAAALRVDVQTVTDTTKVLTMARRQAQVVEEHFAGWQVDKVRRTPLGVHREEVDVTSLPASSEVEQAFGDVDHPEDERKLRGREERWVQWGKHLGMTVSVDWDHDQFRPPDSGAFRDEVRVDYRPASVGTVTTWRITYLPPHVRRDAGGNEHHEPPRFRAHKVAITPMRLVRRDTELARLSLDVDAWRRGKLRVVFNELGEPSELGGESGGELAEAVGELPATAKGAIDAGSALTAALIPGSTHLAGLERRLAIAKARTAIDDVLAAPDPPAAASPTAGLEAEVALAELEARLVRARTGASGGAASTIIYVGSADATP